ADDVVECLRLRDRNTSGQAVAQAAAALASAALRGCREPGLESDHAARTGAGAGPHRLDVSGALYNPAVAARGFCAERGAGDGATLRVRLDGGRPGILD